MAWTMYRPKNPKRAYGYSPKEDWRYETAFAVETDAGVVAIGMDKPGRVFSLGIAQGVLLNSEWRIGMTTIGHWVGDGSFIFDRRIVAMVAGFLMKHGWGGSRGEPYPERGEEIYLPTAEEADAIYEKYNIPTPQTDQGCGELFRKCIEVGDDGKPLDPNAEID